MNLNALLHRGATLQPQAKTNGASQNQMSTALRTTRSSTQAKVSFAFRDVLNPGNTSPALSATNRNTTISGIIHTPFGDYDLSHIAGAVAVAAAPTDPARAYFYTHSPEQWRNDPGKMAEFSRTYGPQAVSVLNQWSKVPENANPALASTADEKAFFRADGTRTYYTVLDLIMMNPEQRKASVDITDSELLNLFWNYNYDVRFPSKGLSGSLTSSGSSVLSKA